MRKPPKKSEGHSSALDRAATVPSGDGKREPIAIIGIGCRFPGARGPQAFWRFLRDGGDAIREVPEGRFDVDSIYDPRPGRPGRVSNRWGSFLDDIDHFDAEFFRVPAREAVTMDPQHRLLMEVSHEALEDAGQAIHELAGKSVGVFIGMLFNDYEDLQFNERDRFDVYAMIGGTRNAASGRVAHAFDFRGPAMVVDTGCSASLTSTHLACHAIWSGECSMALSAGTQLILEPQPNIAFSHARMLANDGRCKFGSRRADGIVRGEGVGVVVLKPLSDALADGDPIYSVIRNTFVNQDGAAAGAMVTPAREGQEIMLRQAYGRVGLQLSQVDYVEAHGTGTPIGDPIEIEVLAKVLGEGRAEDRPLRVGSVKSNLGHTDGAAGIASLIKASLAITHGEIPPTLHSEEPNPRIAWDKLPIRLQQELGPWPQDTEPRRAGVSGFGLSGSNAHIVLEQAPDVARQPAREAGIDVLPLSAKTPQALADLATVYREFLDTPEGKDAPWPEICRMASTRRTHYKHRAALVASDQEQAQPLLEALAKGNSAPGLVPPTEASEAGDKLVFVFPGHGSQWLGMGRELAAREEVFRRALEKCSEHIEALAGYSLLDELNAEPEHSRIDAADVTQAAIFSIGVALAELWRSWGVEPDAVAGHSLGEVTAAHVAGILTLEEAVQLIVHRGRAVLPTVGAGGVAVVGLGAEATAEILGSLPPEFDGKVSVGGENSPTSTVVTGDSEALDALFTTLESREIFCRRVRIDYPSHSPHMDGPSAELQAAIETIQPAAGTVLFYSTVTGEPVPGTSLDGSYWARNLRRPVRFAATLERLLDDGHGTFLELGGHPVLAGVIRQASRHWGRPLHALSSLRRDESIAPLLENLGALYSEGREISWHKLHAEAPATLRLPTYPWQGKRFWMRTSEAKGQGGERGSDSKHPLLGRYLSAATGKQHFWEVDLELEGLSFLRDHRVQGRVVFPGAAMLEMVLAAAAESLACPLPGLQSIRFERALTLSEKGARRLQLVLGTDIPDAVGFQIFSCALDATGRPADPWVRHAAGILLLGSGEGTGPKEDLDALRTRYTEAVDRNTLYDAMRDTGTDYGPRFRNIAEMWQGQGEALARIEPVPALLPELEIYGAHPALLDACLHALLAAQVLQGGDEGTAVPVALEGLRLHRRPMRAAWSHVRLQPVDDGFDGDVRVLDAEGEVLLEARLLRCRRLDRPAQPNTASTSAQHQAFTQALEDSTYRFDWRPAERPAPSSPSKGGWIVLADAKGVGEALKSQLQEAGLRSVTVQKDDFDLAAAAERLGVPVAGVVHLGALDGTAPGEPAAEALDADLDLGVLPALRFAQAMVEHPGDAGRLVLITRGAQAIGASAPTAAAQAALWGLGRTLASEHPELRCQMLDLPATEGGEAEWIAAELLAGDAESHLALRDGARLAARLVEVPANEPPVALPKLKDKASYLITGGLGGIGLALAEWLVARGARCLGLLGRSAPKPEARAAVSRLEAAGARVEVLSADVSDREQLATALAKLEAAAPLAGLFHAAGVLDDKILMRLNGESVRRVVTPKALGAVHLHHLVQGKSLDHFVLFSSASSVVGNPGQANYAAANAVLGALTAQRQTQGLPALCIDWGAWAGVGMAASDPTIETRAAQRGFRSFPAERGLAALGRLLGGGPSHAVVMPFDWQRWARVQPSTAALPLYQDLLAATATSEAEEAEGWSRARLLAAAPDGRRALAAQYLQELLASQLGTDQEALVLDTSINRMGVDSLMAVELKNRIESDLGVAIPMVALLEGPTLEQLAGRMVDELGDSSAQEQTPRIERLPEGTPAPLAHVQERIWYVEQLEPGAHEMLVAVRLTGPVQVPALERALATVVRRHDALHSRFILGEGGEPVQIADVPIAERLPVIELRGLPEDVRNAEQHRLFTGARRSIMNLETGPPIRFFLLCMGENQHVLQVDAQHMVMDAWSWSVFLEEFSKLYASYAVGESLILPEMPLRFGDYANWQRQWLKGQVLEDQLRYWREHLAGAPHLELPTDREPPATRSLRGGQIPFEIPAKTLSRVSELCRSENTTLFTFLMAVFDLLLARHAQQDEVVVGINVAGRPDEQGQGLIGCFVNTLALRVSVAGNPTFRELLRRVRKVVLKGLEHQDAPYDKVVADLRPERRLGRAPLFQVMFDFGNDLLPEDLVATLASRDLKIEVALDRERVRWDIHLYIEERGDGLFGILSYSSDLFDEATIQRIQRRFVTLLESATENPEAPLSDLEMRSSDEIQKKSAAKKKRDAASLKKLLSVKPKAVGVRKTLP